MTEVAPKDSRASRRRNSQPENPVYVKFEHIKDSDCLFGKGRNRMHIGNVAFRSLIRSRVESYQDAPSRGYRVRIIIDALDSIHDAGGRMLRLHDEAQKIWLIMDRESARDKVGDSIRDIIKTRKRRKIPEAPRNDIVSSLDKSVSFAYIMELLTSDIDKRLKRKPLKNKKRAADDAHTEGKARAAAVAKPATGSLPSPITVRAAPSVGGTLPFGAPAVVVGKLKPPKNPPKGSPSDSSVGPERSCTNPEQVRSSTSIKSNADQPTTEIVIPMAGTAGQVDHSQSLFERDLRNARSRYQIDRALTGIVSLHAASRDEDDDAFISRLQQQSGAIRNGGPTHEQALRNVALRRSGLQSPYDHENIVADSAKRLAAALEMQRIAQGEIERETRLLSKARAGSSAAAAENPRGLAIRDLLLNLQSGRDSMMEADHQRQDIQALLLAEERQAQATTSRLSPSGYSDPLGDILLLARAQAPRGMDLPLGGLGRHDRQDQWVTASRAVVSLDRDRDLISHLSRRSNIEDLLAEARAFDSGPAHAGLSLPSRCSFHGAGPPISRDEAEQELARQRHAAFLQIERGCMMEHHQQSLSRSAHSIPSYRQESSLAAPSEAASDHLLGAEFVDPRVATALGVRPSDQDVLTALAAQRKIQMESEAPI